jgi:hypothetical protein
MQAVICFLDSIKWWSSPVRLITSIIAGWRELALGRAGGRLLPLLWRASVSSDRSALCAAPVTFHGTKTLTAKPAGVPGDRLLCHKARPRWPFPREATLAIPMFFAGRSRATQMEALLGRIEQEGVPALPGFVEPREAP